MVIEVEIILIGLIVIFIVSYRTKQGESVYKFISQQAVNTYKKLEPYSFNATEYPASTKICLIKLQVVPLPEEPNLCVTSYQP